MTNRPVKRCIGATTTERSFFLTVDELFLHTTRDIRTHTHKHTQQQRLSDYELTGKRDLSHSIGSSIEGCLHRAAISTRGEGREGRRGGREGAKRACTYYFHGSMLDVGKPQRMAERTGWEG